MTWATASVLVPFLDWPTGIYADGGGVANECDRALPQMQGDGVHVRCGFDVSVHDTPAELLQAIRQHAATVEHVGVTWHLQVWTDPHGERHWTDDVREPSPEEIAIAASTADGSFWRLDSGAVVAETTHEAAQRYRIVAEVKP
jgi:hypothetical protein